MKNLLLAPFLILVFAFNAASQDVPSENRDFKQAFMAGSQGLVVKGTGAAPSDRPLSQAQKKMLALRAAKLVAIRELAEVIKGIPITGETHIKDMAVASDTFRTTVDGFVQGAQVIKETYDQMNEEAVVYVAMPMTGTNGVVGTLLLPAILNSPPAGSSYAPPVAAAAPTGQNNDGLILDVRDQPFKPALINRVLTKNGEVVYDPAKVAQNILVERGAAEYTNDVGKAKALLSERGASNPLVVKAGGVVKGTDAEVGPDDATAIFRSNQTANFLEGAKVVFVLK
ncbi:MAG: hypothetical protein HY884_08925 [Deltaproteobacteria bacterium]|nr:hypothetical protein [Deltaproteobacteria bacterium]